MPTHNVVRMDPAKHSQTAIPSAQLGRSLKILILASARNTLPAEGFGSRAVSKMMVGKSRTGREVVA